MKNSMRLTWVLMFVLGTAFAQQKRGITGGENWLRNWTNFNPGDYDYDKPTQILTGDITENITLFKKDIYLIVGNIFVTNNATLTIEPGTVIMADVSTNTTLTITKGAKIKAEGLALDPIVFTSSASSKKPGDWGGIVILGDAPTNKVGVNSIASAFYPEIKSSNYEKTHYGGKKAKSNSGIFKYVRIEYAGKKVKDSNVANALLLAAIGSKTEVNNVMVSYSGDNAFNIIGDEVNLEQMVSYKSKGNDYKFSYGTQSTISNSLAARYSGEPSSSGSQCLNVVSYDKRQEVDFNKKGTSVSAKNMTFLTHSNDVKSDIKSGLIQNSIYVGVHSSLKMDRSVISSFNKAVVLSDEIDLNQSNLEKIRFTNMYFNNCNGNIFLENNENNEDLEARYGNAAFFNIFAKHAHSETFVDIESKRPNYDLRI